MATKNTAQKTRTKVLTSNTRMIETVKRVQKGVPVSVAMRQAGYSPAYAKNPQDLVATETFRALLNENGISLDDVTKVHAKLLQSKREDIQQRAVDTAYKVHGVYERAHNTTTAIPIQINIIPPDSSRIHDVVDRGGGCNPRGE